MQGAFDIAKQAVSNDPAILRAEYESDKFLLLPAGADHAVALCRGLPDGPLVDLSPHQDAINNLPAFFPLHWMAPFRAAAQPCPNCEAVRPGRAPWAARAGSSRTPAKRLWSV